jgi:hypothetical protein
MQVQIIDNFDAVFAAIDAAETRILLAAGREVQRLARESMQPAAGPAPRGQPPHRHHGDLAESIAVGINTATDEVVVGPRESFVGVRGQVLEFAGTYLTDTERDRLGRFAKRHRNRKAPSYAKWAHPFMQPAIERVASDGTFAGKLAGSFEP